MLVKSIIHFDFYTDVNLTFLLCHINLKHLNTNEFVTSNVFFVQSVSDNLLLTSYNLCFNREFEFLKALWRPYHNAKYDCVLLSF